MTSERCQHLLDIVGPLIQKKRCRSRTPIPAGERLMVTLRYLATGESQQSLAFAFRISKTAIHNIIRETCEALWAVLHTEYLSHPRSTADWVELGKEFEKDWNFPNCLGAVDGKHVAIECPQNAGSVSYNYKHFHSLILMAICDAKYCFTFIDTGCFGGENDSTVFQESEFGKAFENIPTKLGIPVASIHGNQQLPYVLIGDDIFPLKPWLLKPYPGKNLTEAKRIFNYRLSRARRTIENSFGILSARWRIFRHPIKASVEQVDRIVKACLCLHNYLRLTENALYTPSGFVDCEDSSGKVIPGTWRSEIEGDTCIQKNKRIGGNRYTFEAERARENFKEYFNSEAGEVQWQLKHVRSCGLVHNS